MPDRTCLSSIFTLSLFLIFTVPALGQQITVQNGGTIAVANGAVWDLSGTPVDLGGTGSTASIDEASDGRFYNGQLTAVRALNSPSSADPAGLGIEITASKDLGDVTVTRGHAVQTGNGNSSIERYYDVSPSQNNSGLSATLTHSYEDAELNGLSESNLVLFKSTDGGSSWDLRGADSRDGTNDTVTLNGIESFSRWTLGSETSPLPVELASFEATQSGEGAVQLEWSTASETNNAGFVLQHKTTDDGSWEKIGFVESTAAGGTTTDPESIRDYRFTAEGLAVGTHRFRLKQRDLDGTTTAHDPVTVELQMQEALQLSAPAPNPVQNRTTLSFAVKERAETTITLYNALGQKVRTLYRGTPAAGEAQTVQLETARLSSGVYFLRLRADSQTKTRRVTVVN